MCVRGGYLVPVHGMSPGGIAKYSDNLMNLLVGQALSTSYLLSCRAGSSKYLKEGYNPVCIC